MEKIQLMNVQRQHEMYAGEYEEAVLSVLRSGKYIGGEQVENFEKEFASYYESSFAVSCGNGTDALVLALRALGIGKNDEVITTPFTFFATAESIAAVGATPVFVDVCEDYCMNADLIEEKITNKTKAILPVHFYGNSANMDKISTIAKKHGLKLICDCAQAAGTKYNGKRKSILGDVACFSFFPTKNLGCDGDGGIILTNDEKTAKACRAYKVHGSGADGLSTLKEEAIRNGRQLSKNIPIGSSKYYNYLIGYNSRLDALQAALLRKKLLHLDEFIEARRKHAKLYNDALKDTSYVLHPEKDYSYNSYYLYVLRHKNAAKIMEQLTENGIACGTYYPVPLHLQGAFSHLGYTEGSMPNAEEFAKTTFAIPVFPELYAEEQNYIIQVLLDADKEHGD